MATKAIVCVFAALLGPVAALGAPAGAAASPSANTYIGLYSDLAHADWCAEEICPGFCPLTLYVWVFPGYRGAQAVEFDIAYPSNVIASTVSLNCSVVNCIVLCLQDCYAYAFMQCQTDWVWVRRQNLYIINSEPGVARVVFPPGLSQVSYASCEPDFTVCPLTILNEFYFNSCSDVASERSTWGSIKSLYGR